MASFLLKCGGDPNISNIEGVFPVHIVSSQDNVELLQLLIQSGSHVNVQDDDGDTPLHYAAREGRKSSLYVKLFRSSSILIRSGIAPKQSFHWDP